MKLTPEKLEMDIYETFKTKSLALKKITYHPKHYLYGVSALIKDEGVRVAPNPKNPDEFRELMSINAILKHDIAQLLERIQTTNEVSTNTINNNILITY
jgi:hypothetical protein